MSLSSSYDSQVIEALALHQLSTTQIAHAIKVDDGALTVTLFRMANDRWLEVCDATGSTPIWKLTDEGRAWLKKLRGW
jgi:hypothetical protein